MESYAIEERKMIESWDKAQNLLGEIRRVLGVDNPTPVDWERYQEHLSNEIKERKRRERLAREASRNPQPRTGYRKRRFQ